MDDNRKRKADDGSHGDAKKKPKQWRIPKKGQATIAPSTAINPGDAGIWITCDINKEHKATAEIRDIFDEYASILYDDRGGDEKNGVDANEDADKELDIEKEINLEVSGIRDWRKDATFLPVKIDIHCVLFFKTRPPVKPVSFVHKICSDALTSTSRKKSRWIKRFTPMTRMGKASEKGLEELSKIVLKPHFHAEGVTPKKFAIRTSIRNNNVMKRDDVIKQVATTVGSQHSVDLKNYDLLILLDIYRNVLGMSVVDNDFEQLKRFNLAEIYDPTPKPELPKKT